MENLENEICANPDCNYKIRSCQLPQIDNEGKKYCSIECAWTTLNSEGKETIFKKLE